MKKIIFCLILLMPLVVFADVDQSTQTTYWQVSENGSDSACFEEENKNNTSALANGTSGYYLQCVKVSCSNGKNVHMVDHPLSSALTCANGNTNPYNIISSSGGNGVELEQGKSCDENGLYLYATQSIRYDCSKTYSGADYISNSSNNGGDTNNNSNNSNTEPSNTNPPDTGVEDYIGIFGISIILFVTVYYVINKKKVFKETL